MERIERIGGYGRSEAEPMLLLLLLQLLLLLMVLVRMYGIHRCF